jgi:hypothetical protein
MEAGWIAAEVSMVFHDVEAARIVFQAIDPDNRPLPEGLEIIARLEGRTIHMGIRCGRPLPSFLATLDDILNMSHLAEEMVALMRKP